MGHSMGQCTTCVTPCTSRDTPWYPWEAQCDSMECFMGSPLWCHAVPHGLHDESYGVAHGIHWPIWCPMSKIVSHGWGTPSILETPWFFQSLSRGSLFGAVPSKVIKGASHGKGVAGLARRRAKVFRLIIRARVRSSEATAPPLPWDDSDVFYMRMYSLIIVADGSNLQL